MLFQGLGGRKVEADFSGGHLSSDGGVLLLRQIDRGLGVSRLVARCFRDGRDPHRIEHTVEQLITQRLQALALGYEDLNDHDELRRDPLLAVAAEKEDPLGMERLDPAQRGRALASGPTLNRLELSQNEKRQARYHKIVADAEALEETVLNLGVRCLDKGSPLVILDFDTTADRLHGEQEKRFFHGYYKDYCYLPLFCFAGEVLLWAQLRPSDIDASAGTVAALEKIVPAVRKRLPQALILLRADSGFAREEIFAWCEGHDVYYVCGMARNKRLQNELSASYRQMWSGRAAEVVAALSEGRSCLPAQQPSQRRFVDFEYRTRESWSRSRRLIGKAEITRGEGNPRFIVTNIGKEGLRSKKGNQRLIDGSGKALYEETYCARGEAENHIKQMKLDLHCDRTSTRGMASNQLRLWMAALAYGLLERMRTLGLHGTQLAQASMGTIRLRLLKVAAHITVSVRRIHVRLSSAFALKELFDLCRRRLMAAFAAG
jgi:hypothetical protein